MGVPLLKAKHVYLATMAIIPLVFLDCTRTKYSKCHIEVGDIKIRYLKNSKLDFMELIDLPYLISLSSSPERTQSLGVEIDQAFLIKAIKEGEPSTNHSWTKTCLSMMENQKILTAKPARLWSLALQQEQSDLEHYIVPSLIMQSLGEILL